jgi:iron-sulfur cluster assembly protein CyaY
MDSQTFIKLADACLSRVEEALEDIDPDVLDFNSADGLLQLEFADGTKFILNRQSGNHQMWLAAGVRAWHFDWTPASEEWLDARDGKELFARLSQVVSEKLGQELRF